ncbi:MAG: sulfate ABC transporter substrate-binding protein [Planctomycetia bacterium]|nr:sulfate ABC transporter substrate-binding protein [Planctomycetia bacterium]
MSTGSSLLSLSRRSLLSLAGVSFVGMALCGCSDSKTTPSGSAGGSAAKKEIELLNVSYDPTRELWKQINEAFIPKYEKDSGKKLSIKQSHGGSSSQARSVIDGLDADVVTLAIWPDVDQIRKAGLIAEGWEKRLPNHSLPYTSTIVFVVRKGNPKGIKDWADLIRPDVKVITPSPKTSGNGKLSFIGAWGSVTTRGGSAEDAQKFVSALYKNVPVLDSGARGATVTFAQRGIGDVHLTWENEAHYEIAEAKGELEIINPPVSVLAEPTVAWVDANVKKKGTADIAKAYLEFLYTPEGQEIIAKNYYRPSDKEVLLKHAKSFHPIELFTVEKVAGSWDKAQAEFFGEGAVFDKIYTPAAK